MTEESEKWKADPKRGEQYLEPRRAEIVSQLETAADAAFYALEEKLAADIDALRKSTGDKKANIIKTVDAARTRPVMEVVRKYWNETPDAMWKHFIYNMTDSSGKA